MKLIVLGCVLLIACSTSLAADKTEPTATSLPVEKSGLQVTLIESKTAFAANEPVNFTLRFKNTSSKSISLSNAARFENWSVRFEEVTSRMPWRLQRLPTDQPEPLYNLKELKPGESVDIMTAWGSTRFPFQYESELILNMPIPPVVTLRPGRYRLWVGVNFEKKSERESPHIAFQSDIYLGPAEFDISDKNDPEGIQASESVKVNSTEFQTVSRPKWLIPAVGARSEIQLGVKVTNRSPTWMQVNLFDTVRVVLADGSGKEFQWMYERDRTLVPDPMVLTSRGGRTIYRNAILEWSEDGKSLSLSGGNGTGGQWHFDGLHPGKYRVHFIMEDSDDELKSFHAFTNRHTIDFKTAPFWVGKAITKDLTVEITSSGSQATKH